MLDRFKLIHVPIDVYQISYIPFTLLPRDLRDRDRRRRVLICFVATIYPSRQAAKLDPGAGAEVSVIAERLDPADGRSIEAAGVDKSYVGRHGAGCRCCAGCR